MPASVVGVAARGGGEVGRLDRHQVDVLAGDRRAAQEALRDVRGIAVGIARRRHALVHLEHVNAGPGHVEGRQGLEHAPGAVAAAERHGEAAARLHGLHREGGHAQGGGAGGGQRVGKRVDDHLASRDLASWTGSSACVSSAQRDQRAGFLRGAALGGCGTASVGNEAPDCCKSFATIAVQPVW